MKNSTCSDKKLPRVISVVLLFVLLFVLLVPKWDDYRNKKNMDEAKHLDEQIQQSLSAGIRDMGSVFTWYSEVKILYLKVYGNQVDSDLLKISKELEDRCEKVTKELSSNESDLRKQSKNPEGTLNKLLTAQQLFDLSSELIKQGELMLEKIEESVPKN